MERFFNTEGPCEPSRHYMLPPLQRLPTIHGMIDRGKYLVLHAPRQVGKTTALTALAQQLTAEGRYAGVLVSMETGAPRSTPIGVAEEAILSDWRSDALDQLPPELQPPPWPEAPPQRRIGAALEAWSRACPRPLVIFLDEIDALKGELLVSVLRQLRSGYRRRPEAFPWSLALCGMRDVRDYQVDLDDPDRAHSQSPFNIKESLVLRNFTAAEVAALYHQHSEATGQRFTPEASALSFELSGGHPWLVNALGAQLIDVEAPDRSQAISAEDVRRAKEAVILRRETHLDSMIERLREPRVRRIIEPLLVGAFTSMDMANDDLIYARDLGLIVDKPVVRIANPIYQEIIPRTLTWLMQTNLPHQPAWYLRPDGTLDMVALLRAFQRFFAENSEAWLSRFDYHEAGPHLMLMAFLQRIVNGGGTIQREFALGSGRADLLVGFGGVRHALELKVRRSDKTLQEGLEQLGGYLDRLGLSAGFLILFDRGERPWAERLFESEATGPGGQAITVFGM